MSENETEDNYQAYAAGVPVEDTPMPADEKPLYEFTSATFTNGEEIGTVVVEEPPAPEPVPEPTPEPELAPKAKAPKVRVEDTVATHVVGTGDQDEVRLDACVYMNKYARKSLTVHHLQRRLTELGYGEADSDRDGWYGELTMEAVKAFQGDNSLEATGLMDADTFKRIFAGDPNVKVIIPE
jgi:hypothetical protein